LAVLRTGAPEGQAEQPGIQPRSRAALAGWPMIIAWAGMLVFALHACTHMVAAGDTWVAMACGRHFINHGVDTVEPFSANSHRPGPTPEEIATWPRWAQWIADKVGLETVKKWHPTGWINQNWLTHVIFYLLVPKSSYADGLTFTSNALVYWKFAIYIIAIICVFYTGVVLGVNPALSAVFACFALFVGRSFLDIRPAGFSNMLVAVFMLILALASRRNILYIWLLVPVTVFWCNMHGGYIYVFIMLIPFMGLHLLASLSRKWAAVLYNVTAWPFFYIVALRGPATAAKLLFFVLLVAIDILLIAGHNRLTSIGRRGVVHTITAAATAFVAMLVFNPFHLTNLTHTFVISASEHAERWRDIHEWQPAFDWDNPVGTAKPFLAMYIIAWAGLCVWAAALLRTSRLVRFIPKRKADGRDTYSVPKIDLPLILIAAFTIYMAIRSRRFIPIAAIAACPVIAMIVDQAVRAIWASANLGSRKLPQVLPMPAAVQKSFIGAGVLAVLFFGTGWGLKFKRVYLDPWPADPQLCSVFMRMTASDAKPFTGCKFIKDNKLTGKMFNYWTEGGFITWGQEPDPNTGRIPLLLFIDGRSQAAYNRTAFDLWTAIMYGGQPGSVGFDIVTAARAKAKMMGRDTDDISDLLTDEDWVKIGQTISPELRKRDVWIAMMPAAQFDCTFVQAIERNPDWRIVFVNNKEKIYVDITTPKGKQLYDGMLDDTTRYPDDFCKYLARAHRLLMWEPDVAAKRQGVAYAIKAFSLNQSAGPMLELILTAARFVELRPEVTRHCWAWYDDFNKNKDRYVKEHGYRLRLQAARLACLHLRRLAETELDLASSQKNAAMVQRNQQLIDSYGNQMAKFNQEVEELSRLKRW